jgi:hypothetical protein
VAKAKQKTNETAISKAPQEDTMDPVRTAMQQAQDGDPAPLRAIMRDRPDLVRLIGDTGRHLEQDLVAWFGRDEVSLREFFHAHLASMREGLRREGDSALEGLLIDRVVVTWLRVQQAERVKLAKDKDGITLAWATVWERRLEIAHRNYLSACKALATVRRLLKPQIAQVNIGAQQVNVAQAEVNRGQAVEPVAALGE